MKKIIEVQRGENAPGHAKWLKDIQKQVGTRPVHQDDGQCTWTDDVPIYATFDVFEVSINDRPAPTINEISKMFLEETGKSSLECPGEFVHYVHRVMRIDMSNRMLHL